MSGRLSGWRRALDPRGGVGRRVLGLGVVVLLVAALLASSTTRAAADGPGHPYDHGDLAELSVATEDVVDGPVRVVVDGLAAHGYWCVQPRRNRVAVQIACRASTRDVRVDLIATPRGAIAYAAVEFGVPGETRERFWPVLDASLLRLWPGERAAFRDLLADAQPDGIRIGDTAAPGDPDDQFSTEVAHTRTGTWSLWSFYTGDPIKLYLRTTELRDHSWPFGAAHYATTVSAATTALRADGFTCATACYRAADGQSVTFTTHDGRITGAEFTLRTEDDGDPVDDPSRRWVRAGLPFLTPAVRAAVGRRIERSRLAHESWHGVVAGTPVDITARPGSGIDNGHAARDLTVVVGIPLLRVERR